MKTRETKQFLMPSEKSTLQQPGKYDIYPSFKLESGKINDDISALVKAVISNKVVVVDGYVGVFWHDFADKLKAAYMALGVQPKFIFTEDYMKSAEQIDQMVAPYLNGDDLVFGKITDKSLSDWFTPDFFELSPSKSDVCTVIVGCGAALLNIDAPLVYVDLPKNELQFRMRANVAFNLGTKSAISNKQTYKRFYFVDWRVLNDHKCKIVSRIDYMVDGQCDDKPSWIAGDDLRKGLKAMSENFFRVRPWFEPGAWGGTWMLKHIEDLNKDVPNLAWSFELMVLENGLLFESGGKLLEVSFDTLMYAETKNVLGVDSKVFKYDFPIRFDYLDTFDGGNLSIQCHPRQSYIRENFGMEFTQDETYYILDCKKDAVVYLGFNEDINPKEFEDALMYSQKQAKAIDIAKYVKKLPAKKHDLFLIPNGTIHGSGTNNMVLEISSSPYIFTFKMYDWMRLDLDGKPRPINIEHGMKNLYFDRCGDKVEQELVSKPAVIENKNGVKLEHLPTHKKHFYDVYRYSFAGSTTIETQGKSLVMMVVEGVSVVVETHAGVTQRFNYAETFVIPAAAKRVTLTNEGGVEAVVVMSRIKDHYDLND